MERLIWITYALEFAGEDKIKDSKNTPTVFLHNLTEVRRIDAKQQFA